MSLGLALRIGAVLLAFVAGWQVNGWRLERATLAAQLAQAGQGLAQSNEIRRFEHAEATRTMEIAHAVTTVQVRNARITAAAVADAGSLRDTLVDALTARRSAEDTAAACQQRAAVAGELLAEGLRVQAELAGAGESVAADYRGLLAAVKRQDGRALNWPD